jgi:hypothetical protein
LRFTYGFISLHKVKVEQKVAQQQEESVEQADLPK